MPMAMLFDLNGGGTFYIFDLRTQAIHGEYPIVASHAGSPGWNSDDCWFVAGSFQEACVGANNIDELRSGA
jgi:hypothetical protein